MRNTAFIIFFSIVLIVYGAVNTYIFVRGLQAIPSGSPWRNWFPVLFWLAASTFILARVLERFYPSHLSAALTWIGSFWLGFMLFFFLAVVLIDLARLLNSFFHFLPAACWEHDGKTRLTLFWSVFGLSVVLVTAGFINARIPMIRELNISISKSNAHPGELTIATVSDIHLGTIIASRKADRLVEKINSLQPDLVLFAGDIVDEDLVPVIRYNLGESLNRIRSRLGTYAVTGNHEFIGGADSAVKYLEEHGVRMLRDTALFIDGHFYLLGREDRDKPRFTGRPRKEIEEIVAGIDTSFPVIMLDHQPFDLEKHAALGIDLQLSGHTHHGQIWPFNYVTRAIYEVSRGYKRIGNAHFYVSSGYGTWGPPIRLGNRPEIVKIKVRFIN